MNIWRDGTSGVVQLPDGRRVRGRGLRAGRLPADPRPDLGLYLATRPPAPQSWETLWVCWPDFWLPLRTAEALDALRHVHTQAASRRVEIACPGGVGRTGTAIALLARLAGVPGQQAVSWTRAHYRPNAVETPWQRRFVARADLRVD